MLRWYPDPLLRYVLALTFGPLVLLAALIVRCVCVPETPWHLGVLHGSGTGSHFSILLAVLALGFTMRTFGVRVEGKDGGTWIVAVSGSKRADDTWGVELSRGVPEEPTFVYSLDAATLEALDEGRINALTAQGKAFPGDASPMDIEWLDGAEEQDINAFSFHFWTRGFPEKVPFARDLTRVVHGASNVAIYYEPGLRTIWSSLEKGDRVNNGPGQPIVVPFPAMTPYEWWNEDDEPAEALLLFFGKGA